MTRAATAETELPPAPPVRPARDPRLDIVRGWLQLTIFASHAFGSFIGGWMIHTSWGLSDSSELFVFLSGYTLGSVFVLKMMRQGFAAATKDMLGRAARLYRTHLIVAALFFAMLLLACHFLPVPMEPQGLGWGFFMAHPFQALPGLLTMLYQPAFMGILPVFIWCMLLLPIFAWLQSRIGNAALALSAGLYAASWIFHLSPPSLGPDTGIAFNPFAWQFLFLGGAWLGRRSLLLGQALPPMRWLTIAATAVLLAGLFLRLGWHDFLGIPALVGEESWIIGKDVLGFPRLLHAMALAWIVAAMLPRDAAWMHRALPRFLAAIGRHSLQVFCLGLFVSWGCATVFRLYPGRWWMDPLLIVTGAIILGSFAHWLEARRGPRKPQRQHPIHVASQGA